MMKKNIKGNGIIDVIKNPIGTIKETLKNIPSKLSYGSKETLAKYGEKKIIGAFICRTPLNKILTGVINNISFGVFNDAVKKAGFDKLFHLSLIVILDNTEKITIEKNEVVSIKKYSSHDISKLSETKNIINIAEKRISLNELIERTKNYMGDSLFYDYNAFNNNCQFFIKGILIANNLNYEMYRSFLFQNLDNIYETLKNKRSYVINFMNMVTNLGSRISRLTGQGKKDKTNDFKKFIKKNEINIDNVDDFIKYYIHFLEINN